MATMAKVLFCSDQAVEACTHAVAVQNYASGNELSNAVNHLKIYRHCRHACRYGRECTRYQREKRRVDNGLQQHGLDDQSTFDQGHCLVYHHNEDRHTFENPSFCSFQHIPRPPFDWASAASSETLIQEVVRNGFIDVLTTPEGMSLSDIVHAKIQHPIHVMLGRPLNTDEMLAIILFTGTDIQADFNDCHRQSQFEKWIQLRRRLFTAIRKLQSSRYLDKVWRYKPDIQKQFAGERVSDNILRTWNKTAPIRSIDGSTFSYVYGTESSLCDSQSPLAVVNVGGSTYQAELVSSDEYLRGSSDGNPTVQFPEIEVDTTLWRGIQKTAISSELLLSTTEVEFEYCDFMSTSRSKDTAVKFLGKAQKQGILLSLGWDETAIYADVSWISKFPEEQEILFAPTKWKAIPGGVVHVQRDGGNYVLARCQLSGLTRW